ncbi:unnamed protein product [Amoebophrya sp. A25]|nr:unnamed protein product [Amoebophrya sp. A25]|eukprot:GSA25T00000937001.1
MIIRLWAEFFASARTTICGDTYTIKRARRKKNTKSHRLNCARGTHVLNAGCAIDRDNPSTTIKLSAFCLSPAMDCDAGKVWNSAFCSGSSYNEWKSALGQKDCSGKACSNARVDRSNCCKATTTTTSTSTTKTQTRKLTSTTKTTTKPEATASTETTTSTETETTSTTSTTVAVVVGSFTAGDAKQEEAIAAMTISESSSVFVGLGGVGAAFVVLWTA